MTSFTCHIQFCYLDPVLLRVYFLALYYETGVMLSWALVELGQAHYKNFPAWLHKEGIRLDLISFCF